MPLYDYQCSSCNYSFELRQSFQAEPRAMCPRCEATSSRVFHPVPVIYKGTGFYTTDYARKGTGNAERNEPVGSASSKD